MTQIGTHVEFDDEDGNTLHGTVFHLLPCLTNGRTHAVIEIDTHLPGITHTVPVDRLRPITTCTIFNHRNSHLPLIPRFFN